MKRKLFFWIDKLKIKRSERIMLSVCMISALILSGALLFIDFSHAPDEYDYSELEELFRERSKQQKQEHDMIMARYGGEPALTDTMEPEENVVQENVKSYEIPEPEVTVADTTRINVNTANSEELQQLPGIGPAYASRIVEWRQENGKFQTVEQLLEIRGIGPARLENIRHLVEL
ncbi:ComEA family DNA-binding protein [Rhodohalobacter sp. SW132]|uniref:ComEA family DNA-binding protein n=1 Tax=Rhodohalobacter sp. SW132 TaxID=2293433 RepID=UPI000E244A96|nr:ComEA family DNA-binding protein [Rhodohalobacter sp. SW132]REL24555.1 ComEA family DNA-binding protein [Rhodohalobacter sp. SW132]